MLRVDIQRVNVALTCKSLGYMYFQLEKVLSDEEVKIPITGVDYTAIHKKGK